MANGVRSPLAYSGSNYGTPVPNSMGYSSAGVPPQHTPQNFMPPQAGTAPPVGGPVGPPAAQQQYNAGYPNYSPAHGPLPPVSGMQHPQQVSSCIFSPSALLFLNKCIFLKLSYPGAPPTNPPGNQYPNFNSTMDKMTSQMNSMSVTQTGFDKIWVGLLSITIQIQFYFVF